MPAVPPPGRRRASGSSPWPTFLAMAAAGPAPMWRPGWPPASVPSPSSVGLGTMAPPRPDRQRPMLPPYSGRSAWPGGGSRPRRRRLVGARPGGVACESARPGPHGPPSALSAALFPGTPARRAPLATDERGARQQALPRPRRAAGGSNAPLPRLTSAAARHPCAHPVSLVATVGLNRGESPPFGIILFMVTVHPVETRTTCKAKPRLQNPMAHECRGSLLASAVKVKPGGCPRLHPLVAARAYVH